MVGCVSWPVAEALKIVVVSEPGNGIELVMEAHSQS